MAVVERRSQLFKLPSDVLQRSMDRMGCFDACMQFRETSVFMVIPEELHYVSIQQVLAETW